MWQNLSHVNLCLYFWRVTQVYGLTRSLASCPQLQHNCSYINTKSRLTYCFKTYLASTRSFSFLPSFLPPNPSSTSSSLLPTSPPLGFRTRMALGCSAPTSEVQDVKSYNLHMMTLKISVSNRSPGQVVLNPQPCSSAGTFKFES